MSRVFSAWLHFAFAGSFILPLIVIICTLLLQAKPNFGLVGILTAASLLFAVTFFLSSKKQFKKVALFLERESISCSNFLDNLQPKLLPWAIVGSAGLGLLLELVVIRWQASEFEFFAFYKNVSLLACFAGLGCGYAISNKKQIPLVATIPIFAWQILALVALRHGPDFTMLLSLMALPIVEQSSMGLPDTTLPSFIAIYLLLTVVAISTACAFVPIGQACGRLMSRLPSLKSYGFNLLGSIFGVAVMLGMSALWMPPVIWFGVSFILLTLFLTYNRAALVTALVGIVVTTTCLSLPIEPDVLRIYSPYQILEIGADEHGWQSVRAAGQYYQRLLNLNPQSLQLYPDLQKRASYYNLPYKIIPHPKSVLVVGAGTGNDVAAALRAGATDVSAVEIDPAILYIGKKYHPEQPYNSQAVHAVNDDARSFLRNTDKRFDMIVFGLLDSHASLSQSSNLRLDSYVYTVESLKEARACLAENGVLSLSFSVASPQMAHKLYLMMTAAFDGKPPVVIGGEYDVSFTFLQNQAGNLTLQPDMLKSIGLVDLTKSVSSDKIKSDISTDDWPFFYMPERVFPFSYLPLSLLMIGLTFGLIRSLSGERASWDKPVFFWLGAGFMLIETKAITELSLCFGSTWTVVAFTIASILLMAFLSNLLVEKIKFKSPFIALLLLVISLAVGYMAAVHGIPGSSMSVKLLKVVILTCPLFFSGIAFSSLIADVEDISSAMSVNLLGAMCGGMLEYVAMYFGYANLYLVAIAIYVISAIVTMAGNKGKSIAPPSAPT